MASRKRKALGGALAQGFGSVNDWYGRQVQQQEMLKRQKELADYNFNLSLDKDLMDFVQAQIPEISSGKRLPTDYSPEFQKMLERFASPEMAPSEDRRAAPVIAGVKPDDTDSQIISRLTEARVNTDPVFGTVEEGEGPTKNFPKPVQAAMTAREQALSSLKGANQRTAEQAGETRYQETSGGLRASNENFPEKLRQDRLTGEQATSLEVDKQKQLTPVEVERQRQLNPVFAARAGAEATARLSAEWSPAMVAKKLDFEKQKRIAELAQIGDKVQAETVATKNATVRNILPLYNRYRELAVRVTNSWAGSTMPATGSVVNAISRIPAIGEFLSHGLEASHAVATGMVGAESLSKEISELNQLTDTLAQAMANAVIGNRGQTTENDRRTARAVLASSFTHAKTVEDLLRITDKMFTMLPTVAGQILSQDPFATPAQIIEAAGRAAREGGQTAAPAPAGEAPAPDALLVGAEDKLNRRRSSSGR